MSKWKTARRATVPRPDFPRESDGWIWSRYSLYLLINRHCAEFMDDDTVSSALHKVRENIELPYDE